VIALWIGFELTLYGMGLVFLLLAVLWALIALLVRLDNPPAAAEEATPAIQSASGTANAAAAQADLTTPATPPMDPALLAAIFIACRAHRMARRKQAAPELRTHEPGSLPSRWVGSGRTRQNRSWAPGGRFA
jgi:Na+-transporting methylmalonyl-CoA/oxaloacetate decarboxylase gamma subunit